MSSLWTSARLVRLAAVIFVGGTIAVVIAYGGLSFWLLAGRGRPVRARSPAQHREHSNRAAFVGSLVSTLRDCLLLEFRDLDLDGERLHDPPCRGRNMCRSDDRGDRSKDAADLVRADVQLARGLEVHEVRDRRGVDGRPAARLEGVLRPLLPRAAQARPGGPPCLRGVPEGLPVGEAGPSDAAVEVWEGEGGR